MGASPALPPGASSGLPPSDTGPGGLPGRCRHCSSREALQTAQGKIFNSASHFNLKSEKKLKRTTRCQRLRTTEQLIAAPRTGGSARWQCGVPALVGAHRSSRAGTLTARGNQRQVMKISSCHTAAKRKKKATRFGHRELGQIGKGVSKTRKFKPVSCTPGRGVGPRKKWSFKNYRDLNILKGFQFKNLHGECSFSSSSSSSALLHGRVEPAASEPPGSNEPGGGSARGRGETRLLRVPWPQSVLKNCLDTQLA